MANQDLYKTPGAQRPSVDELDTLVARHRLHISASDLVQFRDLICNLLTAYDDVDKLVEPTLLAKYPTTAGYQPSPAQNPYNAWARITNIAGSATGKLAGKTIAIKDNIHISGVPLLNGSSYMRGLVSSYNATVVDRILNEGGFIKGKATNENMCDSGSSFTSASGPVLNPYDTRRSTGGSSSGCAVLVAIGEVDMAIGTDIAGSVRLPACWCGIVGLKPTYGLVPHTGVLDIEGQLDHNGPLARTVQDCALMLEVIAGCDGLDFRQPSSVTVVNYSQQLTGDVAGLRVGLLKEGFENSEADVNDAVTAAAMSLTKLGVAVEEFSFPLHNQAHQVALVLFLEGTYDTHVHGGITELHTKGFKDTATHDFLFSAAQSNAGRLPPNYTIPLLTSAYIREKYGCHFIAKAGNLMREITAAYNELFKRYDIIVMPTIKFKPHLLPPKGITVQEYLTKTFDNATNTFQYNATGNPALSINVGFSSTEPRLPIGMMLVGRHFEDAVVLRLAHAFERLRDSSVEYAATIAALRATFQTAVNV